MFLPSPPQLPSCRDLACPDNSDNTIQSATLEDTTAPSFPSQSGPTWQRSVLQKRAAHTKKFFEAHREEITLHKAAKQAFDELGVKKIPKVKDLNEEYARLLSDKKTAYAEYRKLRNEAQELLIAQSNIGSIYDFSDGKFRRQEEKEQKR